MKKYLIIGGIIIGLLAVVSTVVGQKYFFRFANSSTVFQAFSTPEEFFAAGGEKDFSNVQVLGEEAFGSVTVGNEYNSTSTNNIVGYTLKQLSTGPAVLGSVIIASSSSDTFTLWNATSTTDVSSTTIAKFKASVAEGTYTFDVSAPRGLVISTPTGFNGNYTITWRK